MTRLTPALLAASTLVLGACQYFGSKDEAPVAPVVADAAPAASIVPEAAPAAEPVVQIEEEIAAVPEPCNVIASRDWEAWVNKMPGPDASPKVHVVGKVDVATPGYTFSWTVGPMDRSATPVLRLRLTATKSDGMVNQVITTEEVKYEGPVPGTGVRGVIITCGTVQIGEVKDVQDVY